MHLLLKSIVVQNKHNETITIDLNAMKTLGMRTFVIDTKNPTATLLPNPKHRYVVAKRSQREFYIDEHQLINAFVELPKSKVGERYLVLQDTNRSYRMVNSCPLVKPLKKGEFIVCTKNFMFSFEGKAHSNHDQFSIGETVDGHYHGSQVYYDPDFYSIVE